MFFFTGINGDSEKCFFYVFFSLLPPFSRLIFPSTFYGIFASLDFFRFFSLFALLLVFPKKGVFLGVTSFPAPDFSGPPSFSARPRFPHPRPPFAGTPALDF